EAHARLDWLPQETILFDGARIARTIDVDMHPTARIVIGECVVFGRTARHEAFASGRFTDRWRIHRNGTLVHAEAFDTDALRDTGDHYGGDALLSAPAALGPACAFGTLVALGDNACDLLPAVRACLDAEARAASAAPRRAHAAASAWNGKLVVRIIGATGQAVRGAMERVLPVVTGRPRPRVWNC
ncbi:MAG: urease accessory protein UreD, partial [Pseudomonadota bacterium]